MAISSLYPTIAPSLNLSFALTKALDPRITFTRASTAAYYDGVTTAKAEENLVLQSQDFSTTWGSPSTTVTTNTEVAPDGTTTADTITADAGTSNFAVNQLLTSIAAVYTLSVFAKAGTLDYIQLRFAAAVGSPYVNFDITSGAGAVGTNGGGGSPSGTITDVGNGWYRCSVTATINAGAANPAVFLVSSSSAASAETWTAAGTETVYLWGAQVEQRSAVSAYTPTTTQAITNYIPVLQSAASGVARFDHNPTTGESLGLLVEEQRTNLLTYSAEFDNAAWTKANSSITANTIVAPDGTLTGDKLIPNSGQGGGASVIQLVSKSAVATTYAYSCYAKAGEFASFRLYFNDAANTANRCEVTFNTSTGATSSIANVGTFSGASASMTSIGNGWYRCILIATTSTETSVQCRVTNAGSGQTGDGYSGIYIWGAQIEAGAFPTSYVPTTSASVTRAADAASMTGTNFSSWFNNAEGTVYGEYATSATTSKPVLVARATSTTDNRVQFACSGTAVLVNGVTQASIGSGINITSAKQAFAYKVDDFAGIIIGLPVSTSIGTDTSGTVPVVDYATIGYFDFGGGGRLSGTIKKLAYYPQRLTNAQLQALTA